MTSDPDPSPSEAVFRFEGFALDPATLELRRDGEPLLVQLKVVDLLVHLVRHRERVVEKDELFEVLWPDEVVSEASLTQAVKSARRVLGDDGASQRLIKTVRGRGYRFVGTLDPGGRAPASAESGSRPAPPDAARSALAEALAGAGRMLLLEGAAGAGKSTLVGELLREAAAAGATVARVACAEVPGAPEGWPWARVLDALGGGELAPSALPGPWPRAALGGAGRAGAGASEAERFAIGRAVADELAGLRRRSDRPLVVALEDLHEADPLSLEIVRHVALDLDDSGLLLIVTRRTGAAAPRLEPVLAGLRTKHPFVPVELSGLDPEAVRALVLHELGEEPPASFAAQLARRSGGNPWSARRILAHWAERGLAGGGRWGSELALTRAGVPEEVDALLLQRLEGLSRRSRELLEVAAVFEGRFRERSLQEVAQAAPPTVTTAVDEAVKARLLLREDEGLRFHEPALREAVLAALPAARRRELHRRAARRLELEQLGRGRAAWPAIARHYFEALPLGDVDKCLGFLRAAAEEAEARAEPGEARALLERALLALEHRSRPAQRERLGIEQWLARLEAASGG